MLTSSTLPKKPEQIVADFTADKIAKRLVAAGQTPAATTATSAEDVIKALSGNGVSPERAPGGNKSSAAQATTKTKKAGKGKGAAATTPAQPQSQHPASQRARATAKAKKERRKERRQDERERHEARQEQGQRKANDWQEQLVQKQVVAQCAAKRSLRRRRWRRLAQVAHRSVAAARQQHVG